MIKGSRQLGASERLIFSNPSQARKGAVWGRDALCGISVPEGCVLIRLRQPRAHASGTPLHYDDGTAPTLRCACAGLRRDCTSGTLYGSCNYLWGISERHDKVLLWRCSVEAKMRRGQVTLGKRFLGASERLTFNNPAQARKGAVWGMDAMCDTSVPEGRALIRSVSKKILLSYSQSVLQKESPILFLKQYLIVMFLLVADVVHDVILVAPTTRKSRVFMSPSLPTRERWTCLKPFAGEGLDRLDVLRERYSGRQRHKEMHMVGHAANSVYLGIQSLRLGQDDPIQLSFVIDIDGLSAPIGPENDVMQCLNVTHYLMLFNGFSYYA